MSSTPAPRRMTVGAVAPPRAAVRRLLRPSGRAVRVLSAALVVAMVAAIAIRVDWPALAATLRSAGLLALAMAAVLTVPATLLRGLRTAAVLRVLGHRVPLRRLCWTQLVGQTLSGLTPAATGDLSRAVLWRRDGVPVGAGTAVVVYERVVSLLLLLSAAAVLLAPLTGGGVPAVAAASLGLAVPLAAVLAAPSLVARGRRRAAARRSSRRGPAWLRSAAADLGILGTDRGAAAIFTLWTVLVFLVSGAQLVLAATAVHAALPLAGATGTYAASQMTGSLSALPFGLGTTDATVVALAARLGASVTAAAAVSLVSRLAVTVLPGLATGAAMGVAALRRDTHAGATEERRSA